MFLKINKTKKTDTHEQDWNGTSSLFTLIFTITSKLK